MFNYLNLIVDVLLFSCIFFGFFVYLFRPLKKEQAVFKYMRWLSCSFFLYFLITTLVWFYMPTYTQNSVYVLTSVLQIHEAQFGWKVLILVFYFLSLGTIYLQMIQHNFSVLELPFFVSLLFWFFCMSLYCYNFFFIFLLMELITMLIVIISVLHLIFFNPKLVKVVLQFFVLNLVISTFYLFGVGLFLFLAVPIESYSLSFSTFLISFDFLVHMPNADWPVFERYLKIVVTLWLMTFLSKLTLAPFSVWITSIYSQLPVVVLIILMTIYKVVYFYLFIKIFFTVCSLVPFLQSYWVNLCLLFIIPSMFVGCLAYREQDIRNMLAYTTVSQMGYVLAGCVALSTEALKYALFYLIMYCVQLAGLFIVLLLLQTKYNFTNLNQLYLVKFYNKFYYLVLLVIFFSFLGIPPFSGFFLKYFLFLHIYNAGFNVVAICGLVSGFLTAIVYLQVILQLTWFKEMQAQTLLLEINKTPILQIQQVGVYKLVQRILENFLMIVIGLNILFIFFFVPGALVCETLCQIFFV